MEIRHLHYFLMIAREGTISGAAQALHVSQPSLSRQMHDLEHELGCTLFERGSRRITLTEAGMRLRRRAEEIVDLVGKTEAELRVSANTLAGEVRIGSGETPAMGLIADVIADMQAAYPLVQFSIFSGNAEDVGERLDMGRIDFGLFVGKADLDRYETVELPAWSVWGVLMREGDALAAREAVTPQDLAGRPLIISRQARNEVVRWFKRDIASLDVVATYNLLYNAALLAQRGVGYVICIRDIIETSAANGLVFRPLYPGVSTGIHLAWKRYQTFSPAADMFLRQVRERWG